MIKKVMATSIALALATASLMFASPAQAASTLPAFSSQGEVLDKASLTYNPTGEFIFPSVIDASTHFAHPKAKWYLYYAPHEAPGGVSLAYSNSLDGPWTEYAANPVIANTWSPNYSVNHVSSPDAVWNTDEDKMFLYFHGDNTKTRFATSSDGIQFTYGGVAVDAASLGASTTEVSYARVFPYPASSATVKWGMFFMQNTTANKRVIRAATSGDGRHWNIRPDVLVSPSSLNSGNVSGANLLQQGGQNYVIYHTSSGKIFARPINADLTSPGAEQLFFKASGVGNDTGRAASPEVIQDGNRLYLFYEAGERLDATIKYAVADVN